MATAPQVLEHWTTPPAREEPSPGHRTGPTHRDTNGHLREHVRQAARQIRCLLVHGAGCDSAEFLARAAESVHRLIVTPAASLAAARAVLENDDVAVVFLDPLMPDGDGLAFAREMSDDIDRAKIPVIVLGQEAAAHRVVAAMHSGAWDYLTGRGLDAGALDRAIEGTVGPEAGVRRDGRAREAELRQEVSEVRRLAARNMRLLKSQSLPLLSFAWKMAAGGRVPEAEQPGTARRLARLTRGLTGLIDETTILATTRHGHEYPVPVDLGELVDDVLAGEGSEIRASSAHISRGALPTLLARRSHMALLMQELLLNAVRSARFGVVPEIDIQWGRDPEGLPVVTLTENGIPLSARKQALSLRSGDPIDGAEISGTDPHAWSLCQRLAEKNRGEFRIAETDDARCRVMIRFARDMLVDETTDDG